MLILYINSIYKLKNINKITDNYIEFKSIEHGVTMMVQKIIGVLMLYSFLSLSVNAYALHGQEELLKGPSFSSPDERMDMPESWKKQPVKHDLTNGKADIVVTLNQNYFSFMEPLIKMYAKEQGLRIVLNKGTCGISAGMLSNKTADIVGFCCPPGRTDRLPGLQFHTLGIVALALIVHPHNQLTNISLDDARRIFMGEKYRWAEVESGTGKNLPDLPIQPVGRLHCKLRPGHWRLMLDNEDLFSPGIMEVGAIPDMISQVGANENAIGFESIWMIRYLNENAMVRKLNLNGISPDSFGDLLSGKYPLYRVYNLTTWEEKGIGSPHADKLVKYLLKAIESIDSRYGLVPASSLKKAGWRFRGNELIGEPR